MGVLPGVPPSLPVAARASPVSSAWRSPAAEAEGDAAAPADPDARRPRRCRGTRSHPSATPATNSPNSSIAAQRRRGGRPKARPGAAARGALTGAAGHSLAASCPGPRRLGSGLLPGANRLPSPAARGARLPAEFIGSGYLKKKHEKHPCLHSSCSQSCTARNKTPPRKAHFCPPRCFSGSRFLLERLPEAGRDPDPVPTAERRLKARKWRHWTLGAHTSRDVTGAPGQAQPPSCPFRFPTARTSERSHGRTDGRTPDPPTSAARPAQSPPPRPALTREAPTARKPNSVPNPAA